MKGAVEDLIARQRQRELSPEEEQRLQLALHVSAEARLLYEAGCGFDAASPVQPGDDALIARLADRVETAHAPTRRRRWTGLVAVGGLLVASTAAASGYVAVRAAQRQEAVPQAPASPPPSAVATAARRPLGPARGAERPSPAENDIATAAPSTSATPAARLASARRAATPPEPENTPPHGAAALFAVANQARREGRSAAAIEAYERLQLEFPSSAEAKHADLTLAELYLQGGQPSAALSRFQLYRTGPLSAEARWGEARALRQLGQTEAERAALQRVVTEFPSSAYADAARQRLGEL